MPMVHKHIQLGYGITGEFFRIGNLVITMYSSSTNTYIDEQHVTKITETIPQGYRPREESTIVAVSQAASYPLTYDILPNGDIYMSNGATNADKFFTLTGAYITNDPWPTG